MTVYSYEIKSGTRWGVDGYLGTDEATGKQINLQKRGFKTKKEAQLYEKRAKVDFESNMYKEKAKNYTFQEVYNLWLPQYHNTVQDSTFHKTKRNFENHILPKFSNLIIAKIKPKVIQLAVNEWYESMTKYRELFNMFKRVMKYAYTQDWIHSNPCDKVIIPTKKKARKQAKKTKDFYTKPELAKLFEILDDYDNLKWLTCFRLLAYTGIRRGELLALTWDDIDLNHATLSVNKAVTLGIDNKMYVGNPKNESSRRMIDLDHETVRILKQWRKEQAKLLIGFGHNAYKGNQLLFSQVESNKHLNLSAIRNSFKRICDKYDFEMINIHGFRHTHASLLFEAGVSLKDVKSRLGHSDIQTTMNIYTHVTPQSRKETAEKFAKYING